MTPNTWTPAGFVVERRARDLVEAGEERDVEVRPIEPRAVAGRDRGRGADDRVVHPHAVLKHERNEAGGDRHIERGVAAGPAAEHVAEVAFEEGGVGIGVEEIELVEELGVAVVEFDSLEIVVALQRAGEHVEPLGRREPVVPLEVEPVGEHAFVVAVLLVVRGGRAVVAVQVEPLQRRVRRAAIERRRRHRAGVVQRHAELDQRALRAG